MLLEETLFHVPCPAFWKDLNGCFLGCNKSFLTLAGFDDSNQLIGKDDSELPWNSVEQYHIDDKYVIETGETVTRIENIKLFDRIMVSETTKTPLINQGKIIGILGICLDITNKMENKKLKTELESNKAYIRFIDDLQRVLQSHQVNIINNIIGLPVDYDNNKIELTRRQYDALFLSSRGKASKEIAEYLSRLEKKPLSPSTIDVIFAQLYAKFGVSNRSALIEKANFLRMIPFLPEWFEDNMKFNNKY